MFASIPVIITTIMSIASTAQTLLALGRDVAPQVADLKRLISGDKVTVDELKEMRARNDALNAEIESLSEA